MNNEHASEDKAQFGFIGSGRKVHRMNTDKQNGQQYPWCQFFNPGHAYVQLVETDSVHTDNQCSKCAKAGGFEGYSVTGD